KTVASQSEVSLLKQKVEIGGHDLLKGKTTECAVRRTRTYLVDEKRLGNALYQLCSGVLVTVGGQCFQGAGVLIVAKRLRNISPQPVPIWDCQTAGDFGIHREPGSDKRQASAVQYVL